MTLTLMMRDRTAAGRELARRLMKYRKRPDVAVLALPRGGVPVAAEIARALHAPLDILMARKLYAPGYEDLVVGSVASGGVRVLNSEVLRGLGIDARTIDTIAASEEAAVRRRMSLYRGNHAHVELASKQVVLVDDGLASGATMSAAIEALRREEPARIVAAIPVAPFQALKSLRRRADEVVCLATPEPFEAIGSCTRDFRSSRTWRFAASSRSVGPTKGATY